MEAPVRLSSSALKALCGLCLFCESVYLLLQSNFVQFLEGANLDGSSSITWHSAVVAILLAGACQLISFWAFRRRVALAILGGVTASALACYWLSDSSLGFSWEPHNPDGTGPLTWRTDLVTVVLISTFLAMSFVVRWAVDQWMHRRAAARG